MQRSKSNILFDFSTLQLQDILIFTRLSYFEYSCDLYIRSGKITRVAYVTREECDKTRKAVAKESIPICKMAQHNEGGLPTEIEITLANVNWRQQVQKEKRDAVNTDEVLATTGGNVKNKIPSKKGVKGKK